MTKKYSLGIDLGTSNSSISICTVGDTHARGVNVTQILSPGVVGERSLLPSSLYIPAAGEYAPGSLALPWDEPAAESAVVGTFARERGAQVPDRLVSLRQVLAVPHRRRPHAPILPWHSDRRKASSRRFEASRRYLAHLRDAWSTTCGGRGTRPAWRTPGRAHRARLLRRGGARADPRGRPAAGLPARHAARRAAGRVLRLDRPWPPAPALDRAGRGRATWSWSATSAAARPTSR